MHNLQKGFGAVKKMLCCSSIKFCRSISIGGSPVESVSGKVVSRW